MLVSSPRNWKNLPLPAAVAIDADQVGVVARRQPAAPALRAGQPGGSHARRLERLGDRQRLLRVPGGAVVDRATDAGPDPCERIELLDRRVAAVRDHRAAL